MKNRKRLSATLIILIMILLVLLTVGIIWATIKNILEPDFKIYKEDCWDKGNVIHSFREINLTLEKPEGISINKELVFYRALQESDLDNKNWFDDGTFYKVLYENKEKIMINVWLKTVRSEENIVCEQVEVDELEICYKDSFCVKYKNEEIWVDDNYKLNCNNTISWCETSPKKDLKIDWLDEKCNKEYGCGILSIETKEGSEIEKLGLDKSDCEFKYYKCGENYYVEVER